ncbi:uncharacterized protein SAPINGB_P005005 [Magnusiomyces paraingens]|uniref:Uncharacterized protein n=1 Tax=Magnusiomyces paraingens TaxID=2606893 RepID=A0A5E8C312_9ASCO|nr:uncharacterized protein SAPINGB_P005005 [Saprochaete ingens]VVT56361.1 unnamed protein product [Saprochaete ingens]
MVSDNTFESESSAHYNSSLKANQLDLDITAHLEKIDNFPSTSATDTKNETFLVNGRNITFSLPVIMEILTNKPVGNFFSKIGLSSNFYQVPFRKTDKDKPFFVQDKGFFEWDHIPFILDTSPTSFQGYIRGLLHSMIGVCCYVYMDDIIIFSPSGEQNKKDVRSVLSVLRDNNLNVNLERCDFFREEIEFLGFKLTSSGITFEESTVNNTTNWPRPRNVREVKTFVDFANHFSKLIKNYRSRIEPLQNIIDKGYIWTLDCDEAFALVKNIFDLDPFLQHFSLLNETLVEIGTSFSGMGAVLSQKHKDDNKFYPVAFFSKKFDKKERNYSTYNRELLAIVETLGHWSHYLTCLPFTILSDHAALLNFTTFKIETFRSNQWYHELLNYEFDIKNRPGNNNVTEAALSMIHIYDEDSQQQIDDKTTVLQPFQVSQQEFTDTRLYSMSVNSEFSFANIPVIDSSPLLELTPDLIQAIINSQKKHTKEGTKWNEFMIFNERIYIPEKDTDLINKLLNFYHSKVYLHTGRNKLYLSLRSTFYIENLRYLAVEHTKTCHLCQTRKFREKVSVGGDLYKPILPSPFVHVNIDYITMTGEYKTGLTICCLFSRYIHCIPYTVGEGFKKIHEHLDEFFRHQIGVYPKKITFSNNNKAFHNVDLIYWCLQHNIKLYFLNLYHPQLNSQVERSKALLIEEIFFYLQEHNLPEEQWHTHLPQVLEVLNTFKNFVAKYSSKEIVNCPLDRQDSMWPDVLHNIYEFLGISSDKNSDQIKHFARGDWVTVDTYVSDWISGRFKGAGVLNPPKRIGPFRVIYKINDQLYLLQLPPTWMQFGRHINSIFNITHLNRYFLKTGITPPPAPIALVDNEYAVHVVRILKRTFKDDFVLEIAKGNHLTVKFLHESCKELLEAFESIQAKRFSGEKFRVETPKMWTARFNGSSSF